MLNWPGCATTQQINVWRGATFNRKEMRWEGGFSSAKVRVAKDGFCSDCTPEFQRKHKEIGDCTNPRVVFERDEDGFISGVLPKKVMKEAA